MSALGHKRTHALQHEGKQENLNGRLEKRTHAVQKYSTRMNPSFIIASLASG
jgi:hypothetical protein